MSNRDRTPFAVLLAFVGIGLVAAALALWAQQARLNEAAQERAAQAQQIERMTTAREADRRALSDTQSLVRGLQGQVRSLGGVPLTAAPTPAAGRAPAGPSAAGTPRARAPRRAAGNPSPRPRPTKSPPPNSAPSPSPSPSPTPNCLPLVPVCFGG